MLRFCLHDQLKFNFDINDEFLLLASKCEGIKGNIFCRNRKRSFQRGEIFFNLINFLYNVFNLLGSTCRIINWAAASVSFLRALFTSVHILARTFFP